MIRPGGPAGTGRIGVDARDLAGGTGTGIATYARGLLRAIEAMPAQAECLLPGPPSTRAGRWRDAVLAGLRPPVLRRQGADCQGADCQGADCQSGELFGPDIFRLAQVHIDLWRRPMRLRAASPPDLMHWTSPLPLRLLGCPNLYTVHDLIPLRRPDLTGTDPVRYQRVLHSVLRQADHLLAVSHATRDDVVAEMPWAAGKITALPQVVHLPAGLGDPAPLVQARLGCAPGGYFLFTGSIEPRKNIAALIEAHAASAAPQPLLLLGPDGWRAPQVLAPYAERIGPPGSAAPVWRLQTQDRADQLRLIQGARAMLYPSLAEGFGLPILEAMALGVPVLTSAGGATAEVAGDAAVLVDPARVAEIAAGIAALADAAFRADLVARGYARAACFAPDRYAAGLAALYGRLLGRSGP